MNHIRFTGFAVLIVLFVVANAEAKVILGTGSGALVGNDLTDLGDNGVEGSYVNPPVTLPGDLAGYDAVFFANDEPGFGGGEYAFNVFDGGVGGGGNKWCCGSSSGFPTIVGAMFGDTLATGDQLIQLDRFTLTSSNDTPGRDPVLWSIQGSVDTTDGFDGTWMTIYEETDGVNDWTARNQVISYSALDGDTFLTTDGFKAFRLQTTQTGLTAGAYHALNEIELFGTVYTPVVPEPASLACWGLLGFIGSAYVWRRKRDKANS